MDEYFLKIECSICGKKLDYKKSAAVGERVLYFCCGVSNRFMVIDES